MNPALPAEGTMVLKQMNFQDHGMISNMSKKNPNSCILFQLYSFNLVHDDKGLLLSGRLGESIE